MLEAQTKKVTPSRSDSDIQNLFAEEESAAHKNKQGNGSRGKGRQPPKGIASELVSFKNEIKDMIQELMSAENSRMDKLEPHIMEIKNQNFKIENTNCEIEKSMAFVSGQLTSFETKISGLEKERQTMMANITTIQERVDILDYNLIRTSIEIRNVPKIKNET